MSPALLCFLLSACGRPPAASSHPEAAAEPSAAAPSAVPAAADERARDEEALRARLAAEDDEVTRLLGVAREHPKEAVDALLRIDNDWARGWAAFLCMARLDDEARAQSIFRATDVRVSSAAEALVLTRHAGDERPGMRDVPCWIAERWPEEWAGAFDAYHGSSKDIVAPMCAPPVEQGWWRAHHDAADHTLGAEAGGCGSIRFAYMRSADMELFRAWHVPRTLLDPDAEAGRHADLESARAELRDALGGDTARMERYFAEADAPMPRLREQLDARMRAAGLPRRARERVLARVYDTLSYCSISAVLTCGREPEAP